jgi:tetratricopeptide (TPR) repeat protein
LEKSGYELLEDTFTYDPMNVLYFKMVNASQLVSQAEEAMEQYAYKGAEELINRALNLEPNRPDILYFQSIVLYYQGRKAEARELLENLQNRGIDGDYIKDFLNKLSD